MERELIFSWAENADGKLVHVDSVPRGRACNCVCPCCYEPLEARHGGIRVHGFAHVSEVRKANLKMCYMVILYKLAEQIIQTHKRIRVPSYYGIFKEKNIEFETVKIDSCYEREDKQPDVIATTKDGKQYLIEFTFREKVQHKVAIDYKNLNCLKVDLSNQTFETIEEFLISLSTDREWINNEDYFKCIEATYARDNKSVRLVEVSECKKCVLYNKCCAAATPKHSKQPLVVENNGIKYSLCKTAIYNATIEKLKERNNKAENGRECLIKETVVSSVRSCFCCETNLSWKNRGDYANCGSWKIMHVPQNTPLETAINCKGFKRKS